MNHLKLRSISIALMVAGTALAATGEKMTFHAPILFDLKGPVKEYTLETSNQLTFFPKTMEFLENGKIEMFPLVYNDKGYPTGCDMELNGTTVFKLDAEYTADNLLSELAIEIYSFAPMKAKMFYTYSDGKLISTRICPEVKILEGSDVDGITLKYSDEVYDQYGNWISRKVSANAPEEEGESSDQEIELYTETRTITYYKL